MKVTFSVIKTCYCYDDGETCSTWVVANWDIVAKAHFNSPS